MSHVTHPTRTEGNGPEPGSTDSVRSRATRLGATEVLAGLSSLDPTEPVELRLSVPVCRKLQECCTCTTALHASEQVLYCYCARLLDELKLLAARLPSGVSVARLHWSCNAPWRIPEQAFHRIREAVDIRIGLAEGFQTRFDIDPVLWAMKKPARLSVQGTDRIALQLSRRTVLHLGTDAAAVVGAIAGQIAAAGAARIDAEISCGADWPHGLPPAALAAEMTAGGVARVRLRDMPDAANATDIDALARALQSAGWQRAGFALFARPGDPVLSAVSRGSDPVVLGLGAGARSALPGLRYANLETPESYIAVLATGVLPVVSGQASSAGDRLRSRFMTALLRDLVADLDRLGGDVAPQVLADLDIRLAGMERDGLVNRTGARVTLPDVAATRVATLCRVLSV